MAEWNIIMESILGEKKKEEEEEEEEELKLKKK